MRFNESVYVKFDNSVRLSARSPSLSRQDDDKSQRSPDTPEVNHLRSQRYKPPHRPSKPTTSATRNAQMEVEIRCYECEGLGHFARECPTRRRKTQNPSYTHGKKKSNERSKRSRSPENQSPQVKGREARHQGNE